MASLSFYTDSKDPFAERLGRTGMQVLSEYYVTMIEGGHTLEKFLDDFPSVPRELAIAALERRSGI